MEPLDVAFEKFKTFLGSLDSSYWVSVRTEADVRMKLIDPIFVNVLGWPLQEIHLEDDSDGSRIDYRLTHSGLSRLIVEAKREGRSLGINNSHAGRFFKLNGTVFSTEASQEAIRQLIQYCANEQAELACATNGSQWFIFRGNRLGDGRKIKDGFAFVFGSLDAISSSFQLFHNLLGYESIRDHRFRAEFHQAEGQPIRGQNFRSPVRSPETRIFIQSDNLSHDVDRVMVSFFQDLSGQEDAEARRACFVTTNESDAAEKSLVRVSEELRDKVRSLDTKEASEITETIKRVKEMKKHELILLVGTKGAGKSTFIDRFFADVLPKKVSEDCVIVRVDLARSGGDISTLTRWLDVQFLSLAEEAAFADREHKTPTYEDLQGMFYGEYDRWRLGHAKHLYERDKEDFKIKFGAHIEEIRKTRPRDYIVSLLRRIALGSKKVPCLVFDNADHFDVPFQEEVFNFANSLYSQCLCLVILPITDTTSWQLSKQGALQSFYSDSYFLPTPETDLVLRRRIEFIERKVAEQKPEIGRGYFLGRGIPLEVENIKAFVACLQSVFLSTGEVSTWIGRFSNRDIRRCLQLTREIISSPYVNVGDLLKAFVARTAMTVTADHIKLAIVRGKYDIYSVGNNSFVQNLFHLTDGIDTSPLLAVRILELARGAFERSPDSDARYLPYREIVEYFQLAGVEPRAVDLHLDAMLQSGLILDYNPTVVRISSKARVQISPSGKQHLVWALGDWVYLESMAAVTPILEQSVHDRLKAALGEDRADCRRDAIGNFINYLVAEDANYVQIPLHDLYRSQIGITKSLLKQLPLLKRHPIGSTPGRYARRCGSLVNWFQEKGFGFVQQGEGLPNAFLHVSEVRRCSDGPLAPGTLFEFDAIPNDQGYKAINAQEMPIATEATGTTRS